MIIYAHKISLKEFYRLYAKATNPPNFISTKPLIIKQANIHLEVLDWNYNEFFKLQFGGTTSSFPVLKR